MRFFLMTHLSSHARLPEGPRSTVDARERVDLLSFSDVTMIVLAGLIVVAHQTLAGETAKQTVLELMRAAGDGARNARPSFRYSSHP